MANSLIANLSNTSSTGSIFCKYDEPDSDTEKITKLSFYVLIVLFGIAFNVFVIILAVKCTSRKNLHYLIINMSVSDTIYLLMKVLRNISYLSAGKWSTFPTGILGVIICKTNYFLLNITFPVSLFTLLVISVERYRATRFRIASPYTQKQVVALISICWLIPLPLAMCAAWFPTVSKSRHNCYWPFDSAVYNFISIFYYLLTLSCFAIFFLSIVTIRRLSKPQAIQAHLSGHQRNLRTRRTRAAVKMVLVSVFLYMISWLPSFIYSNLTTLHIAWEIPILNFSACIDWRSFQFVIFQILPIINSIFSPWIYVMTLPDIRESAKKVLCCGERLNHGPDRRSAATELQEMQTTTTERRPFRNSIHPTQN